MCNFVAKMLLTLIGQFLLCDKVAVRTATWSRDKKSATKFRDKIASVTSVLRPCVDLTGLLSVHVNK